MLLPSAFPFDTFHQPHRSAANLTPPPASPGAFVSLSSCRALQAILGSSRPAPPFHSILPTSTQPKEEKPAIAGGSEKSTQRTPLLLLTPNTKAPREPHTRSQEAKKRGPVFESRRSNKRSRAEFESTDANISGSNSSGSGGGGRRNGTSVSEYPSYPACAPATSPSITTSFADRDSFSTPKRQRRVPLLMPLGLSAEDFDGLDPTPKAQPHQAPKELVEEKVELPVVTGAAAGDALGGSGWSAADDRMLVSTVLDKLNLSRKDWNDCGRRIEKDGDSLGKRWGVLVRDSDVALRRGTGARSRPELREVWTGDRTM